MKNGGATLTIWRRIGRLAAVLALAALLPPGAAAADKSHARAHFRPMDTMPATIAMGQTIYVPVYSHVYLHNKHKRLLGATLSIRNTDQNDAIVVTGVRYYDTEGKLLETYVDKAHALGPLASMDFVVDQVDQRGGSGANFIVEWVSERKVNPPIVEAVMIGVTGTQGLSFIGAGRVIATRP